MPDKKNTCTDTCRELEGIFCTMSLEDLRRIDAYARALLYDQKHPGENTAARLREELELEIANRNRKEEPAHACPETLYTGIQDPETRRRLLANREDGRGHRPPRGILARLYRRVAASAEGLA